MCRQGEQRQSAFGEESLTVATDVHFLSTDKDDVLSAQKLLGNSGSQTAQKMAAAINYY